MCIRDRLSSLRLHAVGQSDDGALGTGNRTLDSDPIVLGVNPVSYTHLDVYKRQRAALSVMMPLEVEMIAVPRPFMTLGISSQLSLIHISS